MSHVNEIRLSRNVRPAWRRVLLLVLPAALMLLAGCAQQRPVIYPDANSARHKMSKQQAVRACMHRAKAHGVEYHDNSKAAQRAVKGGIVRGAGGAVSGAIHNNWEKGAIAGVASGATAGLLRGLFKSNNPSPIYRRFVSHCLSKRGYKVIGWQ